MFSIVSVNAHSQSSVPTESILWSFGSGTDGSFPQAVLIMDTSGNLYGTTQYGGLYQSSSNLSGGTAFELTPPSTVGGNWNESILWNFGNGTDGGDPQAGVIMDTSGNLYGTTVGGGAYGQGTVFKLTGGNESILWNFGNGSTDGNGPLAGLIMDTSGNLYGTTQRGGYGVGTVFKLTPPSTPGGNWKESILWNFGNVTGDGGTPWAGLFMDTSGNLYGTTASGGAYGGGTVFEISNVGSAAPTVTLVDPVPQLIVPGPPPATVSDLFPDLLATLGRTVSGVAADGVTELVVRISGVNVGDQLNVTLFNDQGMQSQSPKDDGCSREPRRHFFLAEPAHDISSSDFGRADGLRRISSSDRFSQS